MFTHFSQLPTFVALATFAIAPYLMLPSDATPEDGSTVSAPSSGLLQGATGSKTAPCGEGASCRYDWNVAELTITATSK